MEKAISATIVLLLFISCFNKTDSTVKKPNELNNSATAITINNKDTIGTREFADKLLKGLAKVSDNDVTFACMDSLTSNDVKTRDFYWSVFKIILVKSDGALSEVVGSYMLAYLEKYPKEFTNRYAQLNEDLKGQCVHFAAYEYYASGEGDKEIQALKDVCKNCTSKEKNTIIKFTKEVLIDTKDMKKED
jgi:hypothetical protein